MAVAVKKPRYTKLLTIGQIDDQALAWLEAHGAKVERGAVNMIELDEKTAIVEQGSFTWEYHIHFFDEGEEADHFLYVELNIDAYDTYARIKPV